MRRLSDNNLRRLLTATPGTFTGVDPEGNPFLPNPGEVIDSPWGQSVVERAVPRFSTVAIRDASIPSPDDGQLSYIVDINELQIFDGGDWMAVILADNEAPFTGAVQVTRDGTNMIIFRRTGIDGTLNGSRWQFAISNQAGLRILLGSFDGSTAMYAKVEVDDLTARVYGRSGSSAYIGITNDAGPSATHDFRFFLVNTGQLQLQSSPTGTDTWTVVETWAAGVAETIPEGADE